VTIALLGLLLLLLVAGVFVAALDLSRIGSKAFDRRRALRACRRGWDWAGFERELATYTMRRRGQPPAAQRRR
jgi:hypothetical protein